MYLEESKFLGSQNFVSLEVTLDPQFMGTQPC